MKYLSPKQLGRAIGVSESSLKRWIDDGQITVSRTAGGHRRIELAEAVRFVRQNGYAINDPAVLGLTASDDLGGRADDQQRVEHLHDLLVRGRDKEFIAAVTRLYLDGQTLSSIIDGPIRSAMQRIGELWHNMPDGIAIEHRATEICVRTLGYLHTLIKHPDENAPLAVGGAPPGDIHMLSSLCISLVLAEQGWREMNLGANTPWDQFALTAEREHASLVWISITAEQKSDSVCEIVSLSRRLAELPCELIVGGRQLTEQIRRAGPTNLLTAGSMTEMVAFSRGLLVASRAGQKTVVEQQ